MSSPAFSTELTIYNQDFALVKEVRTLDLQKGRRTVIVGATDDYTQLDANIVRFDFSLAAGEVRTVGCAVETRW